jgi:hypothetical protein
MKKIEILAVWDDEACVWVESSDDVPGLITGQKRPEFLLKSWVSWFLSFLNCRDLPPLPFEFSFIPTERFFSLPDVRLISGRQAHPSRAWMFPCASRQG